MRVKWIFIPLFHKVFFTKASCAHKSCPMLSLPDVYPNYRDPNYTADTKDFPVETVSISLHIYNFYNFQLCLKKSIFYNCYRFVYSTCRHYLFNPFINGELMFSGDFSQMTIHFVTVE